MKPTGWTIFLEWKDDRPVWKRVGWNCAVSLPRQSGNQIIAEYEHFMVKYVTTRIACWTKSRYRRPNNNHIRWNDETRYN